MKTGYGITSMPAYPLGMKRIELLFHYNVTGYRSNRFPLHQFLSERMWCMTPVVEHK